MSPSLQKSKLNDTLVTFRNLDKAYHSAVNARHWQSAPTPSPVTLKHPHPDADLDGSFDVNREQITVKVRTRHGLRRFEMDMVS